MHFELREVQEDDCDLLFEWANDETVRKNAFHLKPIAYAEHRQWFTNKMNSPESLIYLGYVNNVPVGQIRIDVDGDTGTISYSVAKDQRGKGYGTLFLNEIVPIINKVFPEVTILLGKVKHGNLPSMRAFEKNGFVPRHFKDYIEYSREI